MSEEERFEELDRRLREVEQTLAGMQTTLRVFGAILIVLVPILTRLLANI